MTQEGLSIETGNGEWAIMTVDDSNYTDVDAQTVLGVGTGTGYGIDIAFQGEELIDAVWASAGGDNSDGLYNLEDIRDAINLASLNPDIMYDANGNLLAYSAASIIETDAGEYKLQIVARSTSATTLSVTVATNAAATAGDIEGIFGAFVAGGLMTQGSLFESQDTDGDWVVDTAGGAGAGLNILTEDAAITALATITTAINTKDAARASFGYKMNRLESTIAVIETQAENLMVAESRISDVDVATEMAALTRTQVLSQAGVAMLAQANAMPQMALTLLR